MKAVTIPRFGGPEVLQIAHLPIPEPKTREVRIRVTAATVNPTDLVLRAGLRATALPPPYIPGMEMAGTVDALGPGVADRMMGEEVMAIVLPLRPEGGAQAEYVVVPADCVAAVPHGATLVEAATLPMNGLTAQQALDLLDLRPGATLAVTGAAGAVGGYAVQLGKVRGLRIVADAAIGDQALVRKLGADVVVARGEGMVPAIREVFPHGVDGLLDAAVLGETVLAAVRDQGRIAAVRGWPGRSERGIEIRQVAVTAYAHRQTLLSALGQLAGAGQLTLRVAQTFPPESVAEAHRLLAKGGMRGRLVLVF